MPQETVLNDPEISTHAETKTGVTDSGSEELEIDVLEIMTLLLRGKRTILKFMLVAVALAALLAYVVMKPMYTAEATFLPPQSAPGSGLSQLASQLGSLGAVGALTGVVEKFG